MSTAQRNYIQQFIGFFQAVAELSRLSTDVPHYRLVKLPTEEDPYVHFQIVNKRMILKMLPEQIMKDDLLLQFSKADIALITHMGTKNEMKKTFSFSNTKVVKILKQFFQKGKTFFLLEKEEGILEEHSANEIYCNPTISEKLTGVDGMKVGYSVAEEHYQKIIKLKEKT